MYLQVAHKKALSFFKEQTLGHPSHLRLISFFLRFFLVI